MTSMEKDLKKVQEANERLSHLLADQHPGLSTWLEAVLKQIETMAKIIGYDPGH